MLLTLYPLWAYIPATISVTGAQITLAGGDVDAGVHQSVAVTGLEIILSDGTVIATGQAPPDTDAIAYLTGITLNLFTGTLHPQADANITLTGMNIGERQVSLNTADINAVAAAVLAALEATTIPVDTVKIHGQLIVGSGVTGDPWGPA